ncbi:hypothetical protein THASP1DRAFT_30462 [Thamnocephalis sphaerospora]|uniref:Mediator of RNA polymerase II transcription subunit 11 n=1 Tax=Thamnocephalis sphaerospora TaxID=78915 RepID=A0A4P9XQY6_9FUNG|nr:hypothetical protein THASP1DRAFT_30462 [Thamnocephalis sphaerospora]|eukprot:RKP07720.1 hypothetical protein THASP1DRAFT_30462 [Thamnocephalis sphaerospora]
MDTDSPTAKRLAALETIEQRIVELLRVAVEAVDALNGRSEDGRVDDPAALRETFEECSNRYYKLLENIQVMLRQQFRYLTEIGITDADVIFRSQVAGEEKDCAQWRATLVQLRQEIGRARGALYAAHDKHG